MMTPFSGSSWADCARELETLGYSTLFVPDHFNEGYGPITAMATAARSKPGCGGLRSPPKHARRCSP